MEVLCSCGCGEVLVHPESRYQRGHNLRVVNPAAGKPGWNRGLRTRTGIRPSDYAITDMGYSTPCWVWRLGRFPNGYGKVKMYGRTRGAHRISWEQTHGPLTTELVIDHLCEIKPCVNPDHMRAVPQQENMRRSVVAKLTRGDAKRIRTDPRTQAAIAAEYGLSQQQVSKIKRRQRWAEV